ncbi:MAG: hypothetical protein V2I33_19875 [Kangiellaceae bacterium]|nr:hypothetical protein [Kangiellaceae bacterium]
MTKKIELSNPLPKQIIYWIRLEGSDDFYIENDMEEIVIPPKAARQTLNVKFKARISSK